MQPDGGVTFQTPQAPSMLSRTGRGTPQDFVSPSSRKHVSITNPTVFISPNVVNDDEAEKKERRRSRVLEIQRRHLSSPATPADRQTNTAPLSGLSNVQLSEHYANCIKLSTENKINAKNAFGLHLIDYMSELLKKKEMTNFQVASSTLDASAKIYAGRVDAIHSETYKVLTGLGRGAEKSNKDDEDVTIIEEQEGDGPPGAKKRKRARRGKTIETNLKNINVQKLDLAFETDPLFNKTSAAFDEGGTAGLLLNHLHCRDDMSELVLDSNIVLSGLDDHHMPPPQPTQTKVQATAMRDLKSMFLNLKLDQTFICPEFTDFEFANWSGGRDDGLSSMLQKLSKSTHAFDLDAEVETIPESTESESEPQQDFPDDGFGSLEDDDQGDAASHAGDAHNLSAQSFTMGDNKEAQMVQNTIKNIKHGTVGNLMQVLASEPSDYSYFNTNLLQTWAGPAHWKLRPKSKGELPGAGGDAQKKPREKKEAFVHNYDEEINFDKHLKETRAATTLIKATLDKYSKNETTLPEDLHYEEEKLFKLFSKPKVMIKRQKRRSTTTIDAQIENYDYDNSNDKDNFCPAGDEGGDDDDDDNSGGFDFTGATQLSQDLSQEHADDMTGADADGFGSDLVAQPRKIAKIDIGYAKAAKKMDVKKLKSSMWSLLKIHEEKPPDEEMETETSEKEKPKEDTQEEEKEKDDKEDPSTSRSTNLDDSVNGSHSFCSLVKHLPEKITKNMAKNLSVPIAFVCLLHLANEKTLDLKSNDSMDDLTINQG